MHDAVEPFLSGIALNRLMLSKLNVRQTERDADVASLAEDIAARGLKQNLVVIPAHFTTGEVNVLWEGQDRWAGKFEVIAGGRRFQALRMLADAGRIPADHSVLCLIEPRAQASETSLSENLHRVAMNPADEFEAFAAIVAQQQKQGSCEDDATSYTAKRFGVTQRHVRERLRLSALAPQLLEALRAGKIGLDSAKAYALTADHEAQVKVYEAREKRNSGHTPMYVRDDLKQRTVPIDCRDARFVGLDAYREAGGRSEILMFMGSATDAEVLTDPTLLAKLAKAKAQMLADADAKKRGYASAVLANSRYVSWPVLKTHIRVWGGDQLAKRADRADKIACYAINDDASGVDWIGYYKPKADEPEHTGLTPEQRAALQREEGIAEWRARLAMPSLKDTPLADRATYADHWNDVCFYGADDRAMHRDISGFTYAEVMICVRISREEFDAVDPAKAEAEYDAILAKREEAQRASEAYRAAVQQATESDAGTDEEGEVA